MQLRGHVRRQFVKNGPRYLTSRAKILELIVAVDVSCIDYATNCEIFPLIRFYTSL